MDSVLVFLAGLGLGAYFAESIREVAPVLKPADTSKDSASSAEAQ